MLQKITVYLQQFLNNSDPNVMLVSDTFLLYSSGYMNAQHPMTYECLDKNPEYISGQSAHTNGAQFYFVIPDCSGTGTIGHCPPYGHKQLTCAVRSKYIS